MTRTIGETKMAIGLLLIDIQRDYFPGGKMELEGSEAAGEAAGRLLQTFREKHLAVTHVQHVSVRPGATFFLPDTPGVELHPSVQPLEGEPIIQKHFPNSFRQTDLLSRLQEDNIQRLVVAGMMTHMCVDASVRAAADLGFECWIAQDACATRQLKFQGRSVAAQDVHTAFLAALNGTYGRVMTVEMILRGLDLA